ncbi:uncharacterized protein LOC126824845 [Patella vulgata]|uniref:uncharacterized protein LOC126824845 n=1 Tax=Patella vulgata TaxID=6465 RepID=UPI0024A7E418|nr:uncharacterized protein LOC126824845 [Patella vulgata]
MGGLCCCFGDNKKDLSPTTPLLSDKSSSRNGERTPNNNTSLGHSARQHNPDKEKQFLTSLEQLSPIVVGDLPLPALDKTFKDHASLYNNLLEKFEALRQVLHDFKALHEKETNGIPTLKECMKLMSINCGDAVITATRTRYSVQLQYDVKSISECCKGLPEDTLEALALYNKANTLIRNIMEKSPQVKDSIQLVLDDEEKLRREVTKADLSPSEGPEAVKTCARNINNLRYVPGALDTIKKYTKALFQELLDSSKRFFSEHDITDKPGIGKLVA